MTEPTLAERHEVLNHIIDKIESRDSLELMEQSRPGIRAAFEMYIGSLEEQLEALERALNGDDKEDEDE